MAAPPTPEFILPLSFNTGCQPAFRSTVSTTDKAITTASSRVAGLHSSLNNDIHEFLRSDEVWERLITYATVDHPNPQQYPKTLDTPLNRRPTLAEFEEGRFRLHAEQLLMQARRPDSLNAIASVQDEAKEQLINIVNATLMTRYSNSAPLAPWKDANGNVVGNKRTPRFPMWSRGSTAHHPQSRKDPGNPDFVLGVSPDSQGNKSVAEIKPYWVYSTAGLLRILYRNPRGCLTQVNSNVFSWQRQSRTGEKSCHELMLQVYGELVFTQTDIAFISNLDVCFVMVRKKHNNQKYQLVISTPMKWTDRRLHVAVAGLSMLAIDSADWIVQGRYTSIGDILCPNAEMKPLSSPLPQDVEALLGTYNV